MNAAAILQAIAAQPSLHPDFARVLAADPELIEVDPAPEIEPPDYSAEAPIVDLQYADRAAADWFACRTKGASE